MTPYSFITPTGPVMTIKTKWLSLIIRFQEKKMTVDAELSMAAKMMATEKNRKSHRSVHRQHRRRPGPVAPSPWTRRDRPIEDSTIMDQPTTASNEPRHAFHLRSRRHPSLTSDGPRFHIFLVDTGWNRPVSEVLHSQVPVIHAFQPQDPLYVLTREQSIKLLKTAPEHIGHDPMLVVYDLHTPANAAGDHADRYRGFRLNLGLIKSPEQAMHKLQQFLRFLSCHRASERLERDVESELHKQGLGNLVKILREASGASIELI